MNRVARLAMSGAVATTATRTARGALDRAAGASSWWRRTNHAGAPVSLLEGPSLVAGLTTGVLAGAPDVRSGLSAAVAVVGAGGFGMLDDLFEAPGPRRRGLRGHLGALRSGTVTTGAVKIAGIGLSALVSAALLPRGRAGQSARRGGDHPVLGTLLDAALVAGTANLVNLLDVRPGRALKGAAALSVLLAGSRAAGTAGATLGAVVAAAPADLEARDMAGDGGANALGAAVGHAVVSAAPVPVRVAALGGVVALTLASERTSFSAVIARTPWLRAADAWGRERDDLDADDLTGIAATDPEGAAGVD